MWNLSGEYLTLALVRIVGLSLHNGEKNLEWGYFGQARNPVEASVLIDGFVAVGWLWIGCANDAVKAIAAVSYWDAPYADIPFEDGLQVRQFRPG